MAYTKQTWADLPSKTTPINAERLTHIEDGIYSAAQTADTAASTAGTAAANVGIVSGRVETLTGRVNDLDTAVSNKVDKVAGKGLSTNDYTNTDKAKVDALGTASTKNSTSVVTQSSDLVESGAVKDIIGWGNKNKLKFDLEKAIEYNTGGTWSGNTFTKNGVIFTVNADDSISLARVNSSTQSAIFVIDGDFDTTAYEGYIFNGYNGITPSDAGVSIRVIEYSSNDNVQSLTDGATIINNGTPKRVAIRVASSFTPPQGSVVKPMISKNGGTYEPYHASVEDTIPQVVSDAVGWDVGNLLDNTLSKTENGLTVTAQPDGSTIINGTYTGSTGWFVISSNFQVKANKTYWMSIGNYPTDKINAIGFNGYGQQNPINPTADFLTNLRININNGVTFDNLHLYPKIYYPSVDEQKADNSVIGTVEDGTNPTKSYAVDEFMVRDGAFCQVTAPVTTSSTWTEGSNYTKKSIAEVLQSLMS